MRLLQLAQMATERRRQQAENYLYRQVRRQILTSANKGYSTLVCKKIGEFPPVVSWPVAQRLMADGFLVMYRTDYVEVSWQIMRV